MRVTIPTVSLMVLLQVGCGNLQTYTVLDQPTNTPLTASVGQKIWRTTKTRDLPNAFGKADLFGRTVASGYVELRFLGVERESIVLFGFRDVEIYSNETTMSRTGGRFATFQRFGNTTTGRIIGSPSSPT